ncbi:MAG: phosphopantothenoylcysteine decarboxylase [Phycisphaerae bacterium]|jgi:phosphopantothenoylcysteine decarboxylase/phosphopantothenate--cysteine ligase
MDSRLRGNDSLITKIMHFLITAGGTREYIDPVRFVSNASSGKMGYALAAAAIKAGHKATLITTIENLEFRIKNSKRKTVTVETAAQMFAAVKKHFSKCDCLIMAAAVSDYTPVKKSKTKIKKTKSGLVIKLKPTADILKWAGTHKKRNQIVVGFALEDKAVRTGAEKKLKEKKLDMVIANKPIAIGAEENAVEIKTLTKSWLKIRKHSKDVVAEQIIRIVEDVCNPASIG